MFSHNDNAYSLSKLHKRWIELGLFASSTTLVLEGNFGAYSV